MKKPKKIDTSDILSDTIETLELTIRSARRCAYDLKHCAENVIDEEMRKLFCERADYFVRLFQSGNRCKDYRHNLHLKITDLEIKLDTLRAILAKRKIQDPTLLPF